MRAFALSHLGDRDLLHNLSALVAKERATTASLLAHMAEVDARKLYLPTGYSSMFEFCVRKLGLSEDAAYKRIRAARTAREFPAIFAALAEGRLHLTAVVAPHEAREPPAAEQVRANEEEEAALCAAEEARAAAEARAASDRDTLAAKRSLGFRADESRRAVEFSASLADAPLEERVRMALSYFRPKGRRIAPAAASL